MNARNKELTAGRIAIAAAFITLGIWIVAGILAQDAPEIVRTVLAVAGPTVAVLLGVYAFRAGRDGGAR